MTQFSHPAVSSTHRRRSVRDAVQRALHNSTALTPAFAALLLPIAALAQELPTGGTVVSGEVAFSQPDTSSLIINQTSGNAITDWQSFSIGRGSSVAVVQPSTSSAMLARVNGDTPSTISGSLTATGQLVLVNPNGIAISSSGTVAAGGGFVASTLDIENDDFLAGQLRFSGRAPASVSNAGTITVGRGGYAALLGGEVSNEGTIRVPMGRVGLGSGEVAALDFSGDGFLQVGVPSTDSGTGAHVSNSGTVVAGDVEMKAATARNAARQAVNMSGVIVARTVSGRNGKITLGGDGGKVAVSGRMKASAPGRKGGNITITGRDIDLTGAKLDASGKAGGGDVRIGGDWKGAGTLPHAETVSVDHKTIINADATGTGNGGSVVLWSDIHTAFEGKISARGGAGRGNGGDVEVSSKGLLGYGGFTDLSASKGAYGMLLLDPYNVTISTAPGTSGFTATTDDSVINVDTLAAALASANVTITTGSAGSQAGNITVAAPLAWAAPTTLELQAANNIAVNAPMSFGGAQGAGLALNAGNALDINARITVNGQAPSISEPARRRLEGRRS